MKSNNLHVALAQYSLSPHESFAAWRENISSWVQDAVANKAKLLVFPEYCSTDLAMVAGCRNGQTANDLITQIQKYHDDYLETISDLARKNGVYIVAGSFPSQDGDKYYNRSYFMGPNGAIGHQNKIMLTRFEREKTFLSPGENITIFETEFGLTAIAICFDIQFPLTIRKLAEAGCNLLIVPSCTGSLAGNSRVRIGCQARALENQIAVIQSPTVGDAKWQPIADTNHGAAGAYAPPDYGFPETGIVTIGTVDQPGWVYADLDFSIYENVRKNGHVLNWQYWDEQTGKLTFPIKKIKI